MNVLPFVAAAILISASSIYTAVIYRNKKVIILHMLLLSFTPWIIDLLLFKPTVTDYLMAKPAFNPLELFGNLFSTDYLFFKNLPNLNYAVGDYGFFLPSFLPMIFTGLWFYINDKRRKMFFLFFAISIVLSILFAKSVGYISFTLTLIFLSILATTGLLVYIKILIKKTIYSFFSLLIEANVLLLLYEVLRLFHSLSVQMPFR